MGCLRLQMVEDLEEALAAAETEAQMAAEEVTRAARRAVGKPEGAAAAAGGSGGSGTDERVARLQKKAKRASDRVAELRLIIEGPPPLQVRILASIALIGRAAVDPSGMSTFYACQLWRISLIQ